VEGAGVAGSQLGSFVQRAGNAGAGEKSGPVGKQG